MAVVNTLVVVRVNKPQTGATVNPEWRILILVIYQTNLLKIAGMEHKKWAQ